MALSRRARWLAERSRAGKTRPKPLTVRVVNAASVTYPARRAISVWDQALTKAGPLGVPAVVLACEMADVNARRKGWDVYQRGVTGSPESALAIAVRAERGRIVSPRLLPGTPPGSGIRARPILTALVVIDPGTPARWGRSFDVGHAPPKRAWRLRARYLRAFVKAQGSIDGGDLNIGHAWAARILGKRVHSAGVLHLAVPRWIPQTTTHRVDVGSDHPAIDVTLWPAK
jgi:hypothetical protein